MNDKKTTFPLYEIEFSEETFLIEIDEFFDEVLYVTRNIQPPINTYCTEDYECSGGQCTVCLTCQDDCKFGCMTSCMQNCQDSCEAACQSGQGGAGHTHVWSGFVFSYVNNDYHDKYKYCLNGGERHPDQDYRISHSVGSWGSWYNDSGQGKCKSQGTCSDCKGTIAKWKSHSLSTSYAQYNGSQHKKLTNCSDCGYSSTTFESHDTSGQPEYVENGWVKQSCKHCGEGVLIRPVCDHSSAVWGSWKPNPSNALQCKREKVCPNDNTIVDTETKSHRFIHNGQYTPHSETHHMKLGYCGDCNGSIGNLESHSFNSEGLCVCGASNSGGVTKPPVISSFTAIPSQSGMEIKCSVSATNSVRYVYNLYDANTTLLITTSGSTTSTSYTFSSTPNTTYLVAVKAINSLGATAGESVRLTTPNATPSLFTWSVQPVTGKNFKDSVTTTDWEKLQTTVNAWRKHHRLEPYVFVQHQNAENVFSVAYKDANYTYRFFNQIINGLSTIPAFTGSLPSKKPQNPSKWLASDFIKFQTAVNSLKK